MSDFSSDAKAAQAEWEAKQRKVFTKWSCLMLSLPELDLATDFKSGELVCKLLEKLSGKTLGIQFGHSSNRLQVLGSIGKVLKWLEGEGVRFTISPENIYDGDVKLIMGFIWTLILHYQISNKQKIMAWARRVGKMAWVNNPTNSQSRSETSLRVGQMDLPLCAICLALDPKCLD